MIPTVFATTFLLFPGAKRAQMSVLIGLTATLAPTIGPTLGGWLTEQFSWHWLFLINVPVGLRWSPSRCGPGSTSTARTWRCGAAST